VWNADENYQDVQRKDDPVSCHREERIVAKTGYKEVKKPPK